MDFLSTFEATGRHVNERSRAYVLDMGQSGLEPTDYGRYQMAGTAMLQTFTTIRVSRFKIEELEEELAAPETNESRRHLIPFLIASEVQVLRTQIVRFDRLLGHCRYFLGRLPDLDDPDVVYELECEWMAAKARRQLMRDLLSPGYPTHAFFDVFDLIPIAKKDELLPLVRPETEAHNREREKAVKAYLRSKSVGEDLRDVPPATGAAEALLAARSVIDGRSMPGLPAPPTELDLREGTREAASRC